MTSLVNFSQCFISHLLKKLSAVDCGAFGHEAVLYCIDDMIYDSRNALSVTEVGYF